ncbi:hypothetical protein PMZ80_006127 [Knufia obscura]|uniref:Uncharacterized protein n=1 Tax=Knufia obscura TaxID=1635080 RepID=A0ABR0RP37_9EURO|nr:hypothetical protein PMZ80_006127 [Knufia obscura]
MHYLTLSTRSALRSTRRVTPRQTLRPFSAYPRLLIKEDADRSPEEIEKHKQEHLKKQEKGEGEWDRNLASRGEESIAADRQADKVEDHGEHMEDLQKQTAGQSEKEHPEGKAE